MLLELAVGDAYGAGFEYVAPAVVRTANDLSAYHQHPRHRGVRPGMYTDDTQMSLAIAELLVEGATWTPGAIAERFVVCFKRDPREGYAGSFHAFLTEVRSGQEFLDQIRPDSDKSGAAMRAAPLGVLPSIPDVLERCRIQAAITHDTPDGIKAACAAALMTHYLLYDLGPKNELARFVDGHVAGPWTTPWRGRVGPLGVMSVHAAMSAVESHHRMSALLKACVAYGGDVDTVASMALAAASCSREYEQDIPEALVAGLEDGRYGAAYLRELDGRLMRMRVL